MGYIFHKTISNGWDSSYNKTDNNENGCYICYFGGSVSLALNDKSFKNKFAPPTHVWRTELPQDEIDSMVSQLDTIFKNSKANFLGKHVFVNWIDYPYSKGSYSCYKKGQWTSISGKEMEPIGNFYFAGEHCSENFQGFMNGGAETGRHVAEIIRKQAKV
jgi:monoamine oxidase